eukprot:CAMPEP_0172532778 /NCGR_PEP_ID=MMETSP1067-20121228/5704_1 /TAXON_ID=265564 ORGANISM="Thalassiosira punctigera, Strain Tpunct2005C2" /NCGR_SAMPLE_ID=MMETSP1067 /ASSEMBLY_ACC=CAM_ASM_000444 /LENGTH=237 /DNA_ID=CAMNT_0013317331 /DNA_START=40 /DNA_END=754 /DNA_ORIENTATION=+
MTKLHRPTDPRASLHRAQSRRLEVRIQRVPKLVGTHEAVDLVDDATPASLHRLAPQRIPLPVLVALDQPVLELVAPYYPSPVHVHRPVRRHLHRQLSHRRRDDAVRSHYFRRRRRRRDVIRGHPRHHLPRVRVVARRLQQPQRLRPQRFQGGVRRREDGEAAPRLAHAPQRVRILSEDGVEFWVRLVQVLFGLSREFDREVLLTRREEEDGETKVDGATLGTNDAAGAVRLASADAA